MGNSDYSQLSCTVGNTTESGSFDAVYDALYELVLQVKTTFTIGAEDITDATRIWRIQSSYVAFNKDQAVNSKGRIIVVSTGATDIELYRSKKCIVSETQGATVAFLGRETAPISFRGSKSNGTWTTREDDAIQLKGGNLYFRYTNIHDFIFSGLKGTIVLPNGSDAARYVYMSRSSMYNIIGEDAPGIFCKAFNGANDKNNQNSRLYLFSSQFTNCWSKMTGDPSRGGGVIRSYAADRSVLEVRNCTFTGNAAGNNSGNKPTLETGNYQTNMKSSGGGAIYWKSAKGEAKLIGCTFEDNVSTVLGGAVYNTGTMSIEDCTFRNNKSYGWGGAVAVEPPYTTSSYPSISNNNGHNKLSGSLTLDAKTLIENNSAVKDGGGVYFNAFSSMIDEAYPITEFKMELTIDGATIQNNTANNGGGVAMNLDYAGNNYTNGITIKAGSKIIGNTATNNGGAIWMNSTDTCDCQLSKGVTMSGGLLENNQAANGGAIYIEAGKVGVTTMNFVMSDGTVHHNTASANGGAAYLSGGSLTISGGTITENQAVKGGSFYLDDGQMSIANAEIQKNSATESGGVAYLGGGALTVNSGTISQNTAAEKGGVAYLSAGTMTVNGGTISRNGTLSENTTQNGGVAYLGGGTMNVAGGTITENGAVDGGAFYLLDGEMNISNGAIYKNTATQNGGAAYLGGGTLTVSGGDIYQNTATQNGGAAYLASGEMTVSGGKIRENTATENGGAAYLGGGSLTVSGGEIFKNKAVSGGGFYITGGGLTVGGNGSISENEATDSGGGAYVDGGNVTVTGGSIVKNRAANVGGGIAINNGNYRMTGGAVDENRAENGKGGGIYIASDGASVTVDVLSGSISGNFSGADGGAIAVVGVESNGGEGAQQSINVTVGVNKEHTYTVDGNYPNVVVTCDHDGDGTAETNGCPVIKNNTSVISGGGIFISGGKDATNLNIYCLIEDANKTADGKSNSNFMMVEGGQILVTTCNSDGTATNHGFVVMKSSIHVESGDVDVQGGMSNPLIMSDITIDIINKNQGDFDDDRKDDGLFFKVQYYENFDGTGRYKVFSAKKGEVITISGVLFSHNGYDIIGWNTQEDGKGSGTYTVNDKYTFGDFGNQSDPNTSYIKTNLVVYAIWEARGYFIVFDPGVESGVTVEGTMPDQALVYGEEKSINPNQFIYPGYRFVGWIAVKSQVEYADGGKVLNLSSTKGDKIVFRAKWVECDHKNWTYGDFLFTEHGEGGVLERMCLCHGYTETATLTVPEGAVYTGESYTATFDVKYVSLNQYTIEGANWELTIVYTGTNLGNGETEPTNAGYYTATITQTVEDVSYSAYLTFYIDKAQQTQTPAKPTYKASGSSDGSNNNIIRVDPLTPEAGKSIEYQLRWYEGSDLKETKWDTVLVFTLSTSYTNYFVYARYAEDTNYYPSDAVRADWVYYYRDGNVSIQLLFDETKMDCRLEELKGEGSTLGGLMIHVAAKDGYYLTSSFSVTAPTDLYPDIKIDSVVMRAQYHLYGLPSAQNNEKLTVKIAIDGIAVKVQPTSKLGAGEIFGTVSGETATISRDSAYTAYFEISQYDANSYTDMRLEFATDLPIGTTLILVDKTGQTESLWYYVVGSKNVSSVALTAFSQMGSSAQNDTFSVVGTTLKYQFIISFSRVAENELISSNTLQTTLTATPKDDDGNAETETCIPELQSSVSVTLAATPIFSITVTETATFERELQIQYAAVADGAVASKWDAFGGSIVLESKGDLLPSDVHVQVFEGTRMTTYYQNAQGKFVIPVTSRGITTLRVLLISKAFPSDQKTYQIEATLYASCSNASSAPMSGAIKKTVNLTYAKPMEPQPALKVTGTQRVISFDESLTVHVDYQGVPQGGKVEVELWAKDTYGVYSNTATKPGTLENNSDYTTATFEGFANNENRYSYCLMFFVKDGNGNTVLTVPYYFIVYDVK